MPLEVQISTKEYQFERMSLPYENQDFDFETIKKFVFAKESNDFLSWILIAIYAYNVGFLHIFKMSEPH